MTVAGAAESAGDVGLAVTVLVGFGVALGECVTVRVIVGAGVGDWVTVVVERTVTFAVTVAFGFTVTR